MNKFYLSIVFVLLLCAGKVHAQIVFTDINPDVSSTMKEDPGWTSNIVPIDFNNDGTEDYNFRWDDWGTDWFMHMTFAGNNEFILKGTATNPFGGRYIQALDKDAVIDNSGNWGMSFPEPFIGDANDPNFRGLGDKYVGVRFIVGGKKYYGWVLVSFEGKTLTVKEYAYNSVADSPINAGDKGVAGTAVTSVTINGAAGASSITTDDGTLQMSADILPADATNKRVTWSVTETTGKASINHTGLLKALDNGKVTVVAAANDGSGIIAQKEITISGQVIPVINVTRITLTTPGFVKTITTDNGTLQVWPSVTPFNASDKTVTWSINDGTGSAVVDNTGIVTAVSDGTVTVVATANDGSGIKGELEITISGQVPNVNVTGITVTGAADATTITAKDGTLQMSAAVLPADATDKTVTWSVTNGTGSATIDNAGLLTAVTDGTVKVVATANDGSGIKGELEITISGQVAPVLVTGITVTGAADATTITTDNGTLQMSAAVLPADATDKTVTWSVTNGTGSATISDAGLLTAVTDGTVTVVATANDGSGVKGELEVTISGQVAPVLVTGITVTGAGDATTITTDNGTLQMSAAVLPADAADKTVKWSVTNGTGSATISDAGLLTAVTDGTVTVVATANDGSGIKGELEITISGQIAPVLVTGITVTGAGDATTITTDNGTLQMSAAVLPADATDKTVTWSVTNGTGSATIDNAGLLTAITDGTVTVVATANDGSGIKGELEITISGQVAPVLITGITVTGAGDATTITTDNGTLQMSAAILPADATDKTVTWSVTNGTGSATIDNAGLLTAVTDGTVTVVATANDGSGIKGELEITISGQVAPVLVTGITVTGAGDATTITTDNGTLQMSAAVLPADATDKTVTWSVTNGTGSATIDNAGLLTAVTDGTVTVVATANDGSGIKGELVITISGQAAAVLVTGITVTGAADATTITTEGGTLQMSAAVLPADATDKAVTWSVANGTGSAKISDTGLLTAQSNGTVTVIATANDASGIRGEKVITISGQSTAVSSITVSGAGGKSYISANGGTLQMEATVLPAGATDKSVSWTVKNVTGRATIDASGLLTAEANGTVIVRATSTAVSTVIGEKVITINGQVSEILVQRIVVRGDNDINVIGYVGGTLRMRATVVPEDATNKEITWSVTEGADLATIDISGLVTAKSNGTIRVRATANDASGVYGETTVIIDMKSVNISEEEQNRVTVYPNPASGIVTVNTQSSIVIDKLNIVGVDGRLVKSINANGTAVSFDVSELNRGIYILRVVTTDGDIITKRFLKN